MAERLAHLRHLIQTQGLHREQKGDELLWRWQEFPGFDVHVQTDYGDEMGGRTPWELFDEAGANQALEMAEEAVTLAQTIIDEITSQIKEEREDPPDT